jgi:hypothetical protein
VTFDPIDLTTSSASIRERARLHVVEIARARPGREVDNAPEGYRAVEEGSSSRRLATVGDDDVLMRSVER